MELTKKIKAEMMANAINLGHWCYFDRCEWVPHLHKYRYYSGDEFKVYYMSQKQLAEDFDDYCDPEEQNEMISDYEVEHNVSINA